VDFQGRAFTAISVQYFRVIAIEKNFTRIYENRVLLDNVEIELIRFVGYNQQKD